MYKQACMCMYIPYFLYQSPWHLFISNCCSPGTYQRNVFIRDRHLGRLMSAGRLPSSAPQPMNYPYPQCMEADLTTVLSCDESGNYSCGEPITSSSNSSRLVFSRILFSSSSSIIHIINCLADASFEVFSPTSSPSSFDTNV